MADTDSGGSAADTSVQNQTQQSGVAPTLTQQAPSKVEMTSEALKARLDEERNKGRAALLKEFGFEKHGDLKAVLDAAKAKADAELSEIDRLKKSLKDAEPQVKRAEKLTATLKALVDERFASLPEKVRESIDEVAQGDAEERLRMIGIFQKSGLLSGGATATQSHGVTTSPGPAPKPGATQTPWEKYQEIEKTNPLLASAFFQANRAAIDASRPAQ